MTLDQNYALQAVKGIRESFDNAVQEQLEQYKDNRVIGFYTTPEVTEIRTSTEGLSGFKKLGDLETPPSLALEDGYSVTITEERYGGAMELPEKVYERVGKDGTWKVDLYLERQRNQLMKEAVHYMLTDAFSMLNDAFAGDHFLAPDGQPVCGTHTWKSGGQFINTTTAVLSEEAVDAVVEYGGDFTDPSGKPMPLDFDTIIVKKGSPNSKIAKKLFAFGINPTKVADINIYEGTYKIIETPYIPATKKNYWFMRDSSLENSLIFGIGKYPSMNEPVIDKNRSVYSSITAFWKRGVANMPFDIYGSDGTATS
jgi:hypothetical protein